MGEEESTGTRLRIVSFNICGFGAGFGPVDDSKVTATYSSILKDIRRLHPDVVCLQEAKRMPFTDPEGRERPDTLQALAEDLGGMDLRFAHANPGFEFFGNALLVGSRLCLDSSRREFLEGGSVIITPAGAEKRIGRGCLAASLSLTEPARRFAVLVTHWDHIAEEERALQAQSLLGLREVLSEGLSHLLLGDLNSLRRADYTEEEWAALEARSEQRGWVGPRDSEALALLQSQDYHDIVPTGKRWTSLGPPPVRIDYAFASPGWTQDGGGEPRAWVDEEASSSDHQPLVVELMLP